MKNFNPKIAVIGLGYVGLPLALAFTKKYKVVGYDINNQRVEELQQHKDHTLEVTSHVLKNNKNILFSSKLKDIKRCDIYVIGVPTPVNENKQPDLSNLLDASKSIGSVLTKGDIVIYESTVYPGATEDHCVPILEKVSKLAFNKDFFVGYSPERINPGDKKHTIEEIMKVTSGSSPHAAKKIDFLYKSVINAGTYPVSSIKIAEAAKVIENTQRDVNIGLVNELATIFNKLNIDTSEVLAAAETKWNFIPFKPGLVGGHCIGVDPYYLTFKAQSIGYQPEIILAGRRINDGMGSYVAKELIKKMSQSSIDISKSSVLIMGITFKENCPDLRNTKVFDIADELWDYSVNVEFYDPWVNLNDLSHRAKIKKNFVKKILKTKKYSGVILAVAHQEFFDLSIKEIRSLCKKGGIIYDLKNILPIEQSDLRL
jgi:UDP-N-acetyl-D-glucosamine/UDP-N-acetyl-D-galactosamine dehydrogenase